MPAPATIKEFVDLGFKAGLLEPDRLAELWPQKREREAPAEPTVRPEHEAPAEPNVRQEPRPPETLGRFAQALVDKGVLTKYQCQQLLTGRWRGFLLSKKYRLLDMIGSGGMASVYLCEHLMLRRRVAIKVLPASQAKEPSLLQRFYREAEAVAALSHPNIVRAHDVDQDEDLHFLIMEYVDGSSLQEIAKNRGPLDVAAAANYVAQTAQGLQHAHEADLVHRDIKPANLLLDRQGTVKILDLGLARFFHDTTSDITKEYDSDAVLGTADYLSPEQALNSHEADIRSDIYSLGATFYFLLAGHAPFHDKNMAQKIVCHQIREPKPIQEIRADVPAEMSAVLQRMMAKNPDARYQQPIDVAAALQPWTQLAAAPTPANERITQVPSQAQNPPAPQLEKKTDFSKALISIAVVAVFLILVTPFLAWWGWTQWTANPVTAKNRITGKASKKKSARLGYQPVADDYGKIIRTFHDRKGGVTWVAFSPGGNTLFTGGTDDKLVAHTITSESNTRVVSAQPDSAFQALVDSKGRSILAVRSADGAFRWACKQGVGSLFLPGLETTKGTKSLGEKSLPALLCFADNARWLLIGDKKGELQLFDIQSKKPIRKLSRDGRAILDVALLPDENRALGTASDGTVLLWDLHTGKIVRRLAGHKGPAHIARASTDGRHIATAGADGVIRLWNVDTGSRLFELRGHTKRITAAYFLPNDRYLISAGEDGNIFFWDVMTGRRVFRPVQLPGAISALDNHANKGILAAGMKDGKVHLVGCPSGLLNPIPSWRELPYIPPHDPRQVTAVAISPNGNTIATAAEDNIVRLWRDGTEFKVLKGHNDSISALVFSRDGEQLFSASRDKTIRQWHVSSGDQIQVFKGHSGAVEQIRLSSDGKNLLSASRDGTARTWNVFNGKSIRIYKGHGKSVCSAIWTLDRKKVVTTGNDGTIRFWNAAKGKELKKIGIGKNNLKTIRFLSATRLFCVTSDGDISVLDLSGKVKPKLQPFGGPQGKVSCFALTRDKRFVLAGEERGAIRLWDIGLRRTIAIIPGKRNALTALAIDRYGSFAVIAEKGDAVRAIALPPCTASPVTGEQRLFGIHPSRVECLAISRGGEQIATASEDGIVRIWSSANGQLSREFAGHKGAIHQLQFSPDCNWLLSCGADARARLWRLPNAKVVYEFADHSGAVWTAVLSPDGKSILTAGNDATAKIFDAASGRVIQQFRGHKGVVHAAVFMPDGENVMTAGADKTLRLWSIASGKSLRIFKKQTAAVLALAVTPDGKFAVSGGADKRVCFWDMQKGRLLRAVGGHTGAVNAVAISPDGQRALTAGAGNRICLWDIPSRRLLRTFTGHGFAVTGVAFTPDGLHAISCSRDRTLRRWGLPIPHPAHVIRR